MKRSSVVFAFVTMGLLAACGGDDSSTKDSGKKTSSQEKAGSGSEEGGVGCGKSTCKLPKGVTGEPCCRDNFMGTCGIKNGASCRELPKVDDRCPVPELMFRAPMGMGMMGMTMAYGCCTSGGECGIDFGSGCQSRSFLCNVVGPDQAASLKLQKCDGEEIPLPANCGMNMIRIPMPGAAGSGN
jgi:hypothetical protein